MLKEEDDAPSLPLRDCGACGAKKSRFVWVGSLLSFSDSGNRSFFSGSSSSSAVSPRPRDVPKPDCDVDDLEPFPNKKADLGESAGSTLIAGGVDDVPPKMFCVPVFAAAPPNPPNPPDPPNPANPPPAPTLTGCTLGLGLGAEGAPKAAVPNEVVAPKVGVVVEANGPSCLVSGNAAGFEAFPKVPKADGVPEVCPNAPEDGKISRDFFGCAAAAANGFGVVVGVVDEGLNAPKPVEPKFGGGTLGCGVEGGVDPGLSRPGALDAAGRDRPFPDPDTPAVGGV